VKRSTAFWILTYATMAAGFGYGIYGLYALNLYAMITGPLAAGLWARLAEKHQRAEEMGREGPRLEPDQSPIG